jgi:chromosome segregation ATPase
MIELVLVFFLGMVTAGLIWLLLLPAIWRRAARLTLERVERALPLNANEILAERDRERAVFAVERLALDAKIEAARAEVVAAKRELGERLAREAATLSERKAFDATTEEMQARIRALEAERAQRDDVIARLTAANEAAQELRQTLTEERKALEAKLAGLQALS